ncbi:prepilin peptidase [Orrella sp. JC864]|uniref:prepilin peptidase n=1 Tax=Orrella sp. JC864 TaxID=3120298 RepID=UPI003009FC89
MLMQWPGALLCWILAYAVFNLVAAWTDWRARKVPNALVVAAFLFQSAWLGALAAGWLPAPAFGAQGYAQAWFALLALLAGLFPLWKLRVMGAGDVKFAAVSAYFMGLLGWLPALLAGTVAAGLHAAVFVAAQRYPAACLRLHSPGWRRIPYAAYLGMASLAWLGWQLAARA